MSSKLTAQLTGCCRLTLQGRVLTQNYVFKSFSTVMCPVNFWFTYRKII